MATAQLQADIIADLMRVTRELGRVPNRVEYSGARGRTGLGKFPGTAITEAFGSYSLLIRASGLEYSKGKRDKQDIRRQVHEKLIEDAAAHRVPHPPRITRKLLCVSDMYHPYGHPDTVPFLTGLQEKYGFDSCLIGGDEIDSHAMSFHEHDPDLPSPGHELELAIRAIEPLYKLFPAASVLESNHGSLFYRKGKHHGFPRHVLKSYNDILGAPAGWTWRETFTFQFPTGQKAIAHHGYKNNTLAASQERGLSLIQFHFHNDLSIRYWEREGELLWALQSGCLIDDTAMAFAYNKISVKRPIIGCSGVLDGIPVLFPMIRDSKGRWTGRIP